MSQRKRKSRPQSSAPGQAPPKKPEETTRRARKASGPYEAPLPRGVWLVALLAFLLRVPDLASNGLWLDEVYVHDDVLLPIWHNLAYGSMHFVHFLLLKPFLFLKDSPFFLRLPSALSGVLAVPLIYLAVRRLLDESAAFGAALLLAVSPFAVNYSHDANYYSNEILFCLLALYFFARFRAGGSWLNALWTAFCSTAVFFIHPVCGIYLACLGLCWAFTLAAAPAVWKDLLHAPREALRPGPKLALALAALAGLGFLAFFLWPRFLGVLNSFLQGISIGKTPFGVEFSYRFFYGYFRQFGPAFWKPGLTTPVWTYAFFVLFLLGCASAVRRGWIVSAMLWLPFALSFLVLFNIEYSRYFHIRYFSYLTPLYLIGIAKGIEFVARRAHPHLPLILRSRLSVPRLAACGAGLLALTMLPQLWWYFSLPRGNWETALRTLQEKAGADAAFAYTNFAEKEMANYYLPHFGFDRRQALCLGEPARQSDYLPHALKENIFRRPDMWLLSSWTVIQSAPLLDWARKNMTLECYAPSALEPVNAISLYHWPYGSRFVLPPKRLVYRPALAKEAPGEGANGSGASAWAWQETFFFDQSTSYELTLRLTNSASAAARFRFLLDGADSGVIEAPPGGPHDAHLGPLEVLEGARRLGLQAESSSSGDQARLEEIQVAAVQPDSGFRIAGLEAESVYPSFWVWFTRFDGRIPLTLKRKTFATYSFDLNRKGSYEVLLQAVNDRPGPVLLECLVDEEVQGILRFARADNSWEKQGFCLDLAEGRHRISLFFLNEGKVDENLPPDEDNDAIVEGIYLRLLEQDEAQRDDRCWKPRTPFLSTPLASSADPNRLDRGWRLLAPKSCEFVEAPGPEHRGVRFAIAREDAPLALVSPAVPIPPSRLIYYSAQLRAENLNNDSVNLITVFVDETGRQLGPPRFVNREGITRTTDWVRFVEFTVAPQNARAFLAAFLTYHNSKREDLSAGYVSFADFRVHERPAATPVSN